MNFHLPIILISSLAVIACEQSPPADKTADETADESQPEKQAPSPSVEERVPVFPAEIFLESRSPDKGVVRFSGSLVSQYREESVEDSESGSSLKRWKSETSELTFTLLDGRVCKITPTFIEHLEGEDVWQLKIVYDATAEGESSLTALESKEILFDGKSPAPVSDDEHHSIIVRPRTEAAPDQANPADT